MKVPQATVDVNDDDRVQRRILNHVWENGGDHCGCCDCLTCGNCWACGDCPCPEPDLIDPAGRDCEAPEWHTRPGSPGYHGPEEPPFPGEYTRVPGSDHHPRPFPRRPGGSPSSQEAP